MPADSVNLCLHCKGSLLRLPASLSISSVDKELLVTGSLSTAQKSMKELLSGNFGLSLPGEITAAIPFLNEPIDVSGLFIYERKAQLIELSVQTAHLLFVKKDSGMFFLLDFDIAKMSGSNSTFSFIPKIGEHLGIAQLSLMLGNNQAVQNLPAHINSKLKGHLSLYSGGYDSGKPFFAGVFDLTNGKPITKALHLLTGIDNMTLQVGFRSGNISTLIACPSINNKILESKGLIILIEGGANFRLNMQGTFIFKMIPKTAFTISSDISATHFLVSATMQQKEAIQLFGPFAMGNISLLIGYNGGLTFGMACELMAGDINMFGAFVINCTPEGVPEIQMLSGAVTDITLASLISNFTGLKTEGIDWMDAIGVYGFDIVTKGKTDINNIHETYPQVGINCRNLIGDKPGLQGGDDFQLRPYGDGYTLTDNANMRHYAIRKNGTVALQAQFYYSHTELQMGNMRVQRGLFFCGVIEIWKVRISILFFMQYGEKIMAFTHIDPINLGFLELTASSFPSTADQKMPSCPFTDVLVKPGQKKGAMFYFRAEKKILDFYLDGRLKIAGILEVDARIIYSKANVSIDVRYNLFNCFLVSLQVRASLTNFNKSLFSVIFIVDTTGLEKKFKTVSNALQKSIEKCRKTFDNATRELQLAQHKVRGLNQEIDYLKRRIADCRSEYNRAPWYKKLFVGVKVGTMIAAFEVAILGIRTAMVVAQKALKLAELAVKGVGKVAENVLKAAKALMDNILKLFYIRRFAFGLDAGLESPSFSMEMEFVMFGKVINIQKGGMGNKLSESVYSKAESEISKSTTYQNCLKDAEEGRIPLMNFNVMDEELSLAELTERFNSGQGMLKNSDQLRWEVQNAYYAEFGEEIDMRDEMDVELSLAFEEITQVTGISQQMVNEDILQGLSELEIDMSNGPNELLESVHVLSAMNQGVGQMVDSIRQPKDTFRFRGSDTNSNRQDTGNAESFYQKVNLAIQDYNREHTYGNEYINIARELSMKGIIDSPNTIDRNDMYTPRL